MRFGINQFQKLSFFQLSTGDLVVSQYEGVSYLYEETASVTFAPSFSFQADGSTEFEVRLRGTPLIYSS